MARVKSGVLAFLKFLETILCRASQARARLGLPLEKACCQLTPEVHDPTAPWILPPVAPGEAIRRASQSAARSEWPP